ncbi:hypothetical protein PI125_g23845, partial [Phytophthora idaei]
CEKSADFWSLVWICFHSWATLDGGYVVDVERRASSVER